MVQKVEIGNATLYCGDYQGIVPQIDNADVWTGDEVEYALQRKKFVEFCEMKYRICIDTGMPDFSVSTGVKS